MKYKSTFVLLISFLFTCCVDYFPDDKENEVVYYKGIGVILRNDSGRDIKIVRLVIGTQVEDTFVASDTLVFSNLDYDDVSEEYRGTYSRYWDTDLSHIDKAYFKLFYQHELNWNSFPIDFGSNDYLQIPKDKIVSSIDTPELYLDIKIK